MWELFKSPKIFLEPPGPNIAMSLIVPSVNDEDEPELSDYSSESEDEYVSHGYPVTDSPEGRSSITGLSVIRAEDIKDLDQCKYPQIALLLLNVKWKHALTFPIPSTMVLLFCRILTFVSNTACLPSCQRSLLYR